MKSSKLIIIGLFLLIFSFIVFKARVYFLYTKDKNLTVEMKSNLINFNDKYKPNCGNPSMVQQYNSMIDHYNIRIQKLNYMYPDKQELIYGFKKIICN